MMNRQYPFLRWAGGKQWLTSQLGRLVPDSYETYYECFLGGASFFFSLHPRKAVLSDINKSLIETYQAVRNQPQSVISLLEKWKNQRNLYYQIRENSYNSKAERAARFIYLNKTSWNGLYRVNKQGKFNVPFSNNGRPTFERDTILKASKTLRSATLVTGDFEQVLQSATKNDLIYLDPPYTVSHSNNGFRQYNERLFSWDDQIRLASLVRELSAKGCYVIVSNAYHDPLLKLYKGFKAVKVSRHSVLASDASRRRRVDEVLLLSSNIAYKVV